MCAGEGKQEQRLVNFYAIHVSLVQLLVNNCHYAAVHQGAGMAVSTSTSSHQVTEASVVHKRTLFFTATRQNNKCY